MTYQVNPSIELVHLKLQRLTSKVWQKALQITATLREVNRAIASSTRSLRAASSRSHQRQAPFMMSTTLKARLRQAWSNRWPWNHKSKSQCSLASLKKKRRTSKRSAQAIYLLARAMWRRRTMRFSYSRAGSAKQIRWMVVTVFERRRAWLQIIVPKTHSWTTCRACL